jgi:hypothetical protein
MSDQLPAWPPVGIGRLAIVAFLIAVIVSALVEMASRLGPATTPLLRLASDFGTLCWAAWLVFGQRALRTIYSIEDDRSKRSLWVDRRFWIGAALTLVGIAARTMSPHYRDRFPTAAVLFIDGASVLGLLMALFAFSTKSRLRAAQLRARARSQVTAKKWATFPLVALSALVVLSLFNDKWTMHSPTMDAIPLAALVAIAGWQLKEFLTRPGWLQSAETGTLSSGRDGMWAPIEDATLGAALVWAVLGKHFFNLSTINGRLAVVGGFEALMAIFIFLSLAATFASRGRARG